MLWHKLSHVSEHGPSEIWMGFGFSHWELVSHPITARPKPPGRPWALCRDGAFVGWFASRNAAQEEADRLENKMGDQP